MGLASVRALIVVFALAVMGLMFAPGQAQAHGLHGAVMTTVESESAAAQPDAAVAGQLDRQASVCVTCCTSSGCTAINFFDGTVARVFDMPGRRSTYPSSRSDYEVEQPKLGRPPRHIS